MATDRDNDDLDSYPPGCYVAITGSIARGFKFIGPFETMREAVEWAYNPLHGLVTIVEVTKPEDHKIR